MWVYVFFLPARPAVETCPLALERCPAALSNFPIQNSNPAQVPERFSNQSYVVLILGDSKSNHVNAQGTLNPNYNLQDIRLRRGCCAGIDHTFIPPAQLHRQPWCSTIARLLDSIRPPLRTLVCMLYTVQSW